MKSIPYTIGGTYGFLTIISDAPSDKHGHPRVIVQCVCGRKKMMVRSAVTAGRNRSCKCQGAILRIEHRFWSRVRKTDGDGCWEWTGTFRTTGYGQFLAAGQQWIAHRYAWKMANGPIPNGMFVCHKCDNPPCVRVSHLFLGTAADNAADMKAKGRSAKGAKNGSHTRPDRRPRGDRNGSRIDPTRLPRGSAKAIAKVTEADVAEMRRLHAAGVPCSALARRYPICLRNVYRAVQRKTWKHVP